MEIPVRFKKQLWEALQSAFPTIDELEIMVKFGLDENLEQIAGTGRIPNIILELIDWASSRSKFEDLLAAARTHNDTNEDLASFAERFDHWKVSQNKSPEDQTAEEETPMALTPPPGSVNEFTDFRRWSPFVSPKSVHNWTLAMQKASQAICRIESLAGIENYATGFLIGPRLILTAEYVVPDEKIELRFDYELEEDNLTPHQGVVYQLAKHWLIDQKDQSYALMLAEGTPGNDRVNDSGQPRGWLRVAPDYPLQKGEPLFILGHYNSKPITVSHYYVLEESQENSPYFSYGAYHPLASPGLSGAPIFNANWEVVGIHSLFHRQPVHGAHGKRSGILIKYILQQPAVQLALAVSGH